MHGGLASLACLLGRLGPWGKSDPGELTLSEGIVAFRSEAQGSVFRASADEVRVRFPRLYFGLGIKLVIADKAYRLWFVALQSMRGETDSDGQTVMVGNSFLISDVGPAREAVRQWRGALSGSPRPR
jgi:hypothetical protein